MAILPDMKKTEWSLPLFHENRIITSKQTNFWNFPLIYGRDLLKYKLSRAFALFSIDKKKSNQINLLGIYSEYFSYGINGINGCESTL